jgi:hypothetical protein
MTLSSQTGVFIRAAGGWVVTASVGLDLPAGERAARSEAATDGDGGAEGAEAEGAAATETATEG